MTRWSKLGTHWEGVSLDTLLADVETSAEYALVHAYGGYTTNLPLEDLLDGKAWVAYRYDGEELEPEHGGPARLLVPHLYLWKSAKWVDGMTLARHGHARVLGEPRLPHATETHGGSSGTGATDLAGRDRRRGQARVRHRADPGRSTCPAGQVTSPASTSTCG